MSDEQPIESGPGAPEPPDDDSPFELPPMETITKGDDPPDLETRDGE
jgi:hypothetical protein